MSRWEDPADGQRDRSPSSPRASTLGLLIMAGVALFMVGAVLLVLRYGVAVPLKNHAEQASIAGQRLRSSVGTGDDVDESDEDLDERIAETQIAILPLAQADAGSPIPFPAAEDFAKLLDAPDAGAPPSPAVAEQSAGGRPVAEPDKPPGARAEVVTEGGNSRAVTDDPVTPPAKQSEPQETAQNEPAALATVGGSGSDNAATVVASEAEAERQRRGQDQEPSTGPDYWVVPVAAAYGQRGASSRRAGIDEAGPEASMALLEGRGRGALEPPAPWATRPPSPGLTPPPAPWLTEPPAPGLTQPPAPFLTQPPGPAFTAPPAPWATQPPAPWATQPPAPGLTDPPSPGRTPPPAPWNTQPPFPAASRPPSPQLSVPSSGLFGPPPPDSERKRQIR